MLSVTVVALGTQVLGDALPMVVLKGGFLSFPHAPCPAMQSGHDGRGAESGPLLEGINVTQ